ncbi:MAG: ParB/RepB/Spo0J family partition protein [Nitrospinae bacterium]|nr:ParB/RepB/Spo0J family partition protein [Nitrospinota bacterium]
MTRYGGGSGPRRGLAKGLSALLGDGEADVLMALRRTGLQYVPVEFVRPSRLQPRRRFDEGELRALAESIADKGILQPLIVRRDPTVSGSYEIVAGERRWRAVHLACHGLIDTERPNKSPAAPNAVPSNEAVSLAVSVMSTQPPGGLTNT